MDDKIRVNPEKLMALLDLVFNETTQCPPGKTKHDTFNTCNVWLMQDKPCQYCWLQYLMQ